mgnify:CR=1 FL=1
MNKNDLKPTLINGKNDPLAPGLSRRSFFLAAGAAGVGATAATFDARPAQAQSTDWTQPGNNNHVIELQGKSDFPAGEVGIDFYGHCAIKITSPGQLRRYFCSHRIETMSR